eukprot:jgi/Mesvir1/28926/Mv17190-RA.1
MPVDGDVLDYHGLTEEDLADVAKHPGGSSAKERCAAWQMDFAKECGDYDPARAANEILLGGLNMKQCWEHEYKEDLRLECGEDEALFKSLCLSYSAFMKCWKQVAHGNYWPGSPKICMLEYTRNAGVCQTCVLLRTLRRGASSGERRKRYEGERRKHMALVRRERREYGRLCRLAIKGLILLFCLDKIDSTKTLSPLVANAPKGWEQNRPKCLEFSLYCGIILGGTSTFFPVWPWVEVHMGSLAA